MANNNNVIMRLFCGLIITLVLCSFAYAWSIGSTADSKVEAMEAKHYLLRKEINGSFLLIVDRLGRMEAVLERIERK